MLSLFSFSVLYFSILKDFFELDLREVRVIIVGIELVPRSGGERRWVWESRVCRSMVWMANTVLFGCWNGIVSRIAIWWLRLVWPTLRISKNFQAHLALLQIRPMDWIISVSVPAQSLWINAIITTLSCRAQSRIKALYSKTNNCSDHYLVYNYYHVPRLQSIPYYCDVEWEL
jgi:hypothetical protein